MVVEKRDFDNVVVAVVASVGQRTDGTAAVVETVGSVVVAVVVGTVAAHTVDETESVAVLVGTQVVWEHLSLLVIHPTLVGNC